MSWPKRDKRGVVSALNGSGLTGDGGIVETVELRHVRLTNTKVLGTTFQERVLSTLAVATRFGTAGAGGGLLRDRFLWRLRAEKREKRTNGRKRGH